MSQKGHNWLDFFYTKFLKIFNTFYFEVGCKICYPMAKKIMIGNKKTIFSSSLLKNIFKIKGGCKVC
jgi:hypothetical protein